MIDQRMTKLRQPSRLKKWNTKSPNSKTAEWYHRGVRRESEQQLCRC